MADNLSVAEFEKRYGKVLPQAESLSPEDFAARYSTTAPTAPAPSSGARFAGQLGKNTKELASGLGEMALDALKSATTLEGQVSYLPKMAKGMYEGAVDYTSRAIARQLPNGAENLTPEQAFRASVAAVPVVGGYVTNRAQDVEEGKAPEALADIAFDAASMLVPGTKAGRARAGDAVKSGLDAAANAAAKAKDLATKAKPIALRNAPRLGTAIGASAGGMMGGATGAMAGGWAGKKVGDAIHASARAKRIAELSKESEKAALAGEALKKAEKTASDAAKSSTAALSDELKAAKQVRAVEEAVMRKELANAKTSAKFEAAKAKFEAAKATRPAPMPEAPVAPHGQSQRLPQPDPSLVVPGRDPLKLGDRVYAPPPGNRTRISEYYSINPETSVAEGVTGVHPVLGLPMRADGKVLVRNVEDFGSTPGRAPSGAPVWRDPNARFGANPTINEVAQMLEARSGDATSIADVQQRLHDALRRDQPIAPADPVVAAVEPPAPSKLDRRIAANKTLGGDLAAALADEAPAKPLDEAKKNLKKPRGAVSRGKELTEQAKKSKKKGN